MRNWFMSPTEYVKADSENNPFLKQLFYSPGGETYSKFTHKHCIWMEMGSTKQISPFSFKTGHLVEGNLHYSWKLTYVTSFTLISQRVTNLEAIFFQFQHTNHIQNCPKKEPLSIEWYKYPVSKNMVLTSQYRFSWTSITHLQDHFFFKFYPFSKRTAHVTLKFSL